MRNVCIIALLSLSVTVSAQWGTKVRGNGNVVTIERSVGEYDQIASAGSFDVVLVDGKEGTISLKGEENLLEYIKTEVKDGKLVIKKEKGVNLQSSGWRNGIEITIPVEEINAVRLSGSGDVVSKTTLKADTFKASLAGSGDVDLKVAAEEFKASLSGSGDMVLSGSARNFSVSVAGSGDIKAFDLEADVVEANVSGSADLQVTANQEIKARIAGSGDITYKGNPGKIDTKASGSGDISSY